VAIIGVVLALLLPALGRGVARARAFKCQMTMRSVAFDFQVFATPQTSRAHGDDDSRNSRGRFSLETFIESEYGVDEFWSREESGNLIQKKENDPADSMRRPEVKGELQLRRNVPCRAGAVGPAEHVSYSFNSRLYRAETIDSRGRARPADVWLGTEILSMGTVPLAWDVDGVEAARRSVVPHWTAPGLDSRAVYAGNRLWFPSGRHSGQGNYALIDGSVHGVNDPLAQPGWRWSYQPRP